MTRAQRHAFYGHLVSAVPSAIYGAGIQANACILSCRLGVEALRARGIRARPLAVKLVVTNRPLWDAMQLPEDQKPSPEELMESDAWMVTLGYPVDERSSVAVDNRTPRGYDGHLVIIAEERYVLDLSAGQVERLKKGIHAEAFWVESRELARGETVAWQAEDGCVWTYQPEPDRRDYLKAPAWSGYRVRTAGDLVISERSGPMPEEAVAPRVVVPLS